MTQDPITLSQVRGILKCWGDLIRSYGDSSTDGWLWTTEIVLEKLAEERKREKRRATDEAKDEIPLRWSQAEQRLRLVEIAVLRDVATVARFIREQRPLRVAVLAHIYGHQLSIECTARQLGARVHWVFETRRETELDFMHWYNGLRTTRNPTNGNQLLTAAA